MTGVTDFHKLILHEYVYSASGNGCGPKVGIARPTVNVGNHIKDKTRSMTMSKKQFRKI